MESTPEIERGQLDTPRGWAARLRARSDLVLLVILVLFGLGLRLYDLGSFPDTLLADEADNTQAAVRILYDLPPANGLFGFDWTPQPAFSAYKQAAFLAVFGITTSALRLSSAVISALALIPFYLLLRRQFSVIASFLTTILLATDVWYLNFSRSGWNNIDICFYMLMAMLFLVSALKAMTSVGGPRWLKWFCFGAAGFFCALGLYGYPSGRAITLGVAAFFPIALLFNRTRWKTVLLGYLLLFAVEAATFAPQGIYIAKNWDWFNGRTKVVYLMNDPKYQADPINTALSQLNKNIRGPWDGAVNNTAQYSPVHEAQLDKTTGLLVLVGMILSVLVGRLRGRAETWLWWLMLLAGWGFTQLITVGTPNGARGIGYMPTLVYFAAIPLEGIVLGLSSLSAPTARANWASVAGRLSIAALVAAIFLAGFVNVKHYVDWQNKPRTRQDRYAYITTAEFPAWLAEVIDRAQQKRNSSNVGEWRNAHPIQDIANPYSTSTSSSP